VLAQHKDTVTAHAEAVVVILHAVIHMYSCTTVHNNIHTTHGTALPRYVSQHTTNLTLPSYINILRKRHVAIDCDSGLVGCNYGPTQFSGSSRRVAGYVAAAR
jgi:hypothetical protein